MITGWLVGDKELAARLEAMPGKVHQGILRAVTKLSLDLQNSVKAKLNNNVLRVRSATLERSVNHRVEESGDAISGIVGTNVPYAAIHEYGFTGTESVKEHLRTITRAFGHSIKAGSSSFTVRAHDRKVNYPPHSFLRSALAEMEGKIKTELEQAVTDAVRSTD